MNEMEEMVLKNVQLESPSSAVTYDVLGRESVSTLDTERDEYCESLADEEEQEVAPPPITTQQVTTPSGPVTIQTWCKSCTTASVAL